MLLNQQRQTEAICSPIKTHFRLATLLNIDNPIWGISTIGYGVIVEGIAAIRQRMDLAIRTTKGTDPLRPEFGSRVYQYVDKPVSVAVPNIKKEIVEALQMWVPEVKVIAIRHYYEASYNPVFEITYRIVDENVIDKLLFDLKEGSATTVTDVINEIILQAFFPENPNTYPYQVRLERNGSDVFPTPIPSGFTTIQELFQWVQTNWTYLGRWYLLTDKVVCYMNSEGVTSASLSIFVLPIVRFQADFPQLNPGELYNVLFRTNGVDATPVMPQFDNPGEVLSFVQTYWSNYATWGIEFLVEGGNAVFADEFSNEFAVASTGYRLVGVSNVLGFNPQLEISIT